MKKLWEGEIAACRGCGWYSYGTGFCPKCGSKFERIKVRELKEIRPTMTQFSPKRQGQRKQTRRHNHWKDRKTAYRTLKESQ